MRTGWKSGNAGCAENKGLQSLASIIMVFSRKFLRLCAFALSLLALLIPVPADAQAQCGVVDSISYPIDTSAFRIVQDFGAPSVRHEGRFHTGEDWYGARGASLGQPVRAIAVGRVTYSAPNGWGRDGGVVIIEHTFPDKSVAYSMYGHMAETDSVKFPGRLKCVQPGDIIGTVGDARPAPHLHFEIRVNQADIPGPGYTTADPETLGWRHPLKFVTDWQAWLHPAYRWHVDLAEPELLVPPLELDDHSLLILDGNTLKRATADGRVLWRKLLAKPAVSVLGYQGTPLITYTDGSIQPVDYDGTLGESVASAAAAPDSPPLTVGDLLIYHTTANELVAAYLPDRHKVAWRLANVPPFVRGVVATQVIGLLTTDEILVISLDGQLLSRAKLRAEGNLTAAPNGTLVAYTHGGLWTINPQGSWALLLDTAPPNPGSGAALALQDGRTALFDGQTLTFYQRDGSPGTKIAVPAIAGRAELAQFGNILLLVSTHGDIAALGEIGGVCAQTRVFGDDRAAIWYSLGEDSVLRVAIADQIIGLDWKRFARGCP